MRSCRRSCVQVRIIWRVHSDRGTLHNKAVRTERNDGEVGSSASISCAFTSGATTVASGLMHMGRRRHIRRRWRGSNLASHRR